MRENDYEYNYHNLAENADFMDEDECYYDDGADEAWMVEADDPEVEDEYQDYMSEYNNYYHDIIDELDD